MDQSSMEHIKGVVEALLFVNEKPISLQQIKDVLDGAEANEIKEAIVALQKEHKERKSGVVINEIAGGYQMLSNALFAEYVRRFYRTKHKEKLSKPALETLAIVAYKQAVTRSDIELIRGVNSDGVVTHLVNKELIKIVGRKDVAGRPYLYGTTKQFMEYFGLKSLDDLPNIEDFPKLEEKMREPDKDDQEISEAAQVTIPEQEESNLNEAVEEVASSSVVEARNENESSDTAQKN